MVKLDHLVIRVKNHAASRDWYVRHFGFKIEFEAGPKATALQDDAGLTMFVETSDEVNPRSCMMFFQVDDVEEKYRELRARGIEFIVAPQKNFWGYGAELLDPDGYKIGLWDEKSMNRHMAEEKKHT